jgi:putative hydrolase of the HAD superfamily
MPSAPNVRAVVFDLDDTLYPEGRYVRSGYRAVAGHLRRERGRDEPFEEWLWDRFLGGEAAGAFDALSRHFDLGLDPAGVEALVGVYRGHAPDIRPWPGVVELLGRLHAEYRLGLLSDGYLPAQRLKLEALGIGRFFDAAVFTEEMGRECWKPSPAGYERAAELLGAAAGELAYVGDNPAKDFLAPNRLGWRTIQLLRPGQVHASNAPPPGGEPAAVVRLPGDLRAALRAAT